jgi:hypothetical protein
MKRFRFRRQHFTYCNAAQGASISAETQQQPEQAAPAIEPDNTDQQQPAAKHQQQQ